MADGTFNVAKGRFVELQRRVVANDPTNAVLVVVLLKTAAADGTLKDQATLAAILAGGSVECDFTGYARKVLASGDLANPTVENAADRVVATIGTQTWNPAGGVSNNNVVKALICYDPDSTGGTDSDIIPISFHDFVITTNGGSIAFTPDPTDGYAVAGE